MEETIEMPQKYIDMVGTKRTFSGGLFSSKKAVEPDEYDILDWRWGSAKIMDMKTMEMKHPTVEFLLKKEGMRRSQWTRPFPVREIELEPEIL
ncbi:hypothetical protein [Dokdonia sp.]|uniref:hypothetical protein n=1 Tax=Dokdonia sp. TaxID=2024995 RepID=UPI0032673251